MKNICCYRQVDSFEKNSAQRQNIVQMYWLKKYKEEYGRFLILRCKIDRNEYFGIPKFIGLVNTDILIHY